MAEESEHGCYRVAREGVLEGREVCVTKHSQQLIAECSVDVTTFVVLFTLFGVLAEERLLIEWGCPLRDGGRATGVGQAD